VAAAPSVGPGQWLGVLDELMTRVGSRFSRVEPRRRARAFVLGLLAELPRKNCRTIAEHVGDPSPDGMQHLLARAKWDADSVRDDVRGYLIEHLGDPGAVLVIDETGDIKKGTATAGVQRQYTGTAGADRERPSRRLPRIRRPARARPHRPRAVPAEILDR
jgi:SRSO17 transposase